EARLAAVASSEPVAGCTGTRAPASDQPAERQVSPRSSTCHGIRCRGQPTDPPEPGDFVPPLSRATPVFVLDPPDRPQPLDLTRPPPWPTGCTRIGHGAYSGHAFVGRQRPVHVGRLRR